VLGRSRPNKNLVFLFWARPGPEGRAGPGSAWPINKTSWARTSLAQHKKPTGGIISPPSSCMQNECSACRRKRRSQKYNEGEGKFTWRGGGGGSGGAAAAGGGAVAEAGGGVLAHGRWLQAAALLSQPNCGVTVFFQVFLSVSSSPFLYFGSSPFWICSPFSLAFLFSLRFFFLFPFSLSFGSSLPFFFSLLLSPFPPPFLKRSWVLFIEPRAWLFTVLDFLN